MANLGPFPSFGWSHTRHGDFHRCQRLYYHKVYGSWGGWAADPADPAWWEYRLKHLVGSAKQVVGTALHDAAREVVQRIVQGNEVPDAGELYERHTSALDALGTVALSAFLERPKRHPMTLAEFAGAGRELPHQISEAREHLFTCLSALLESEVIDELKCVRPADVVLTDMLDSVMVQVDACGPVKIWAAPDLAYWTSPERETITVVDWKTGSAQGAAEQLATYAWYMSRRFGIPEDPNRFVGRVVTLSPYRDRSVIITRPMIDAAYDRICTDVREMRSFQADTYTNEPVEAALFDMVSEDQRYRCRHCVFAVLCDPLRGAERPSPLGEDRWAALVAGVELAE